MRSLLLFLLLPAVGSAQPREVISAPRGEIVLARQALPATNTTRAESHVIYLNRDGATLRPGVNDSSQDRSSLVRTTTVVNGWDVDDDTWQDTVDCMREMYAPFDITITDKDPGEVSHIEAIFASSPADVGLPNTIGGVSPFTKDCSVIDRSIVFAFTDVLPYDARIVCEVMAQETAHSFGLDHELLASDPMTYLPYAGDRAFQDQLASCGEQSQRPCGIEGSVCWSRQNSHALLLERLGANQAPRHDDDNEEEAPEPPGLASGIVPGCAASGGNGGMMLVLCFLVIHRVSRRYRLTR